MDLCERLLQIVMCGVMAKSRVAGKEQLDYVGMMCQRRNHSFSLFLYELEFLPSSCESMREPLFSGRIWEEHCAHCCTSGLVCVFFFFFFASRRVVSAKIVRGQFSCLCRLCLAVL